MAQPPQQNHPLPSAAPPPPPNPAIRQQNGIHESSADMSNMQQTGNGQNRQVQPTGYPDTSYPSPQLPTSQYSNYPPPGAPGPEYRGSPTGSQTSLSLPSMRSLDPIQQQAQQQHHHQMNAQSVAQMGGQPYYQQPNPYHVTSDPNVQGGMRYQLPPGGDRVMSGGRHKKEIKRRTKTGCLTCRKRRIKCDEGKPDCRNCVKSKRDCLGYDPIFKQQPGPAPIQPAPNNGQMGGMPPGSHPYGNQNQMMAGGYGQQPQNMFDPSLAGGASTPGSAHQFDYQTAIDPALSEGAAGPAQLPVYATTTAAKRTVEQLLDQGGKVPPRPTADIMTNLSSQEEVKHLYYSIYAPGLENFLESKWFTTKGILQLMASRPLLEGFISLLEQFSKTDQNVQGDIEYTSSVEARVVWSLASMVKNAAALQMNGNKEFKAVPHQEDPQEATHRLNVYETLLSGRVAATNPLTAPVPNSTDHHRLRELEFWHNLGHFATINYENTNHAKDIDDTLSALRNLLDGRENRDVLYSMAVVRGLGQRVSEYTENDTPLHLDESDNKSKLLVAKKFVSDEAAGAGTTNVIRRLCDLASRSWQSSEIK